MARFSTPRRQTKTVLAAAVAVSMMAAVPAAVGAPAERFGQLNGPRGLTVTPKGGVIVAQADGTFGRVVRKGDDRGTFVRYGKVPASFLAPALGSNKAGTLFVLTLGADRVTKGQGTLFSFDPATDRRRQMANIQRYQRHDPDPFDLEANPKESNPYGVAGLRDGSALVADAAGNDLLRVYPGGKVVTVARFKPRVVKSPDLGEQGPPPGTKMPSESVPTSVAVGADGAYYVGELRGFPATPGTSQVWRIRPGAKNAVCNPERPHRGACTRYADGFTSVVSLAAGRGGSLYVAELSKKSWLALESEPPTPGAQVGSLIRIGHDTSIRREIRKGRIVLPGGVAVGPGGGVFVSGPIFGPGTVTRVR